MKLVWSKKSLVIPKTAVIRKGGLWYAFLATEFKGTKKIDIGRFKGLGEMMPAQLKETTMDPTKRTLLRVEVPETSVEATKKRVDQLMGTKPEARFVFIQENAEFVDDVDV